MEETSYWFRAVPEEQKFPTLAGDIRADVVIVGGGVAGLSAAYFLSKVGIKVALLEANTLATGDSGFTTAMATRFLESTEASITAWEASASSLKLLEQVIAEEKIDCDWQRVDGIGFSQNTTSAGRKNFLRVIKLLQAKDSAVEHLTKDDATLAVGIPVEAAYRKKGTEAQFHARKFIIGLSERVAKRGAKIFENSEIINIESGKSVVVKTATGSITADQLIVATGIPSAQFFPKVAKKISSAVSYVLDVKFSGAKPFPRALFWDDLDPYHYFRWVSESELLLGGEDWLMNKKRPTADPHLALEQWLADVCGHKNFQVINKWQGTIFSAPDVLPYVGSHQAYGKNTIFLTGWAGNGMTLGFLSGNIAADLIQKKKNLFQNIFSFNR